MFAKKRLKYNLQQGKVPESELSDSRVSVNQPFPVNPLHWRLENNVVW